MTTMQYSVLRPSSGRKQIHFLWQRGGESRIIGRLDLDSRTTLLTFAEAGSAELVKITTTRHNASMFLIHFADYLCRHGWREVQH